MSRYIAKYVNLEKSKRPTFWNRGSSSSHKLLHIGEREDQANNNKEDAC